MTNNKHARSKGKLVILTLIMLMIHVQAGTLNDTQTKYMDDLTAGKPFHAAQNVFTDSMGGFFWLFVMAIVFVSIWIRTQNFMYPTIIVDIIWYRFGQDTLGSLSYIIYAINIFVIASVIYKTYSPTYTGG